MTNKFPNNWLQLKNMKIIEVVDILTEGTQIDIIGIEKKSKCSIFEYPFSSSNIGMFQLCDEPNSEILQIYPLTRVEREVMNITLNFDVAEKLQSFIIPMLY